MKIKDEEILFSMKELNRSISPPDFYEGTESDSLKI